MYGNNFGNGLNRLYVVTISDIQWETKLWCTKQILKIIYKL